MDTNEIPQRFEELGPAKISSKFEVVLSQDGSRVIIRQTVRQVRIRRCYQAAGMAALAFCVLSYWEAFPWLYGVIFLLSAALSYWYIFRQPVALREQITHFEIDTTAQQIRLPLIRFRLNYRTELKIEEINSFLVVTTNSAEITTYNLRCSYGKDEKNLYLLDMGREDVTQLAILLGLLCAKTVWKYSDSGTLREIKA